MPWKTKFNKDDAVNQAIKVFWAKGYKSTSLNDLLSAMHINKGSFYNSFGSKKKLFTKSLEQYEHNFKQHSLAHLMTLDDPILSINSFFELIIERNCNDPEQKGCLFINTSIDLPNHENDTVETIKSGLNDITLFFQERLEKAASMNLINNKIDIPITAKTLFAITTSIHVLSRGTMNKDELISIKDQALKLLY